VFRKVPLTQEIDYQPNDPFPAETHERALDLLMMIAQQLQGEIMRSVHAPDDDPAELDMVLPNVAGRGGKLMAFDSDGLPVAAEGTEFGMLTTGSPNVWTALQSFLGHEVVELQEDGGALGEVGPILKLYRNAAGATNQELGSIQFDGNTTGGARHRWAQINAVIRDFSTKDSHIDGVIRIDDELHVALRVKSVGDIPNVEAVWFNDDPTPEGPYIGARRRSDNPAAGDLIGTLTLMAHDSNLDTQHYFKIQGQIGDPTAGDETGIANVILKADGVDKLLLGFREYGLELRPGAGQARILNEAGDPNGTHSAPVGSIYLRSDGGADTTLYVKETGTGNTGWVAK
jgi:hypothetical protein